MSTPASLPDSPKSDPRRAPQRILDAAAHRIARYGATALALTDVAADAGVSKALIHYHFHDKDTLLSQLADAIAGELLARERASLVDYARQHSPLAVDALWRWLEGELRRGSIRTLLELEAYPAARVRAAARRAATQRREAAAETIERLFTILELRSRVSVTLLANVAVAFIDGLALDFDAGVADVAEQGETRAPRVAFDVFWLAMLSLAE